MANNYLSRKASSCLKGWLALAVLTHHIYQFSGILSGTSFSFIFLNLGYWAVGLFIFLSGFGLHESYKAKGQAYIEAFPRNRILTFEISYIIFAVLYGIYDFLFGIEHTLKEYCLTFTYGSTIVSFGWYLQLSMAMYLIFWFTFRFAREKKKRSLLLGMLLCVFILINILAGIGEERYTPVVYFGVGMLWSVYKEKIDAVLSKSKYFLFLISGIIFLGGYICLWRYSISIYAVAVIRTISGVACIVMVQTLVYICHQLGNQSEKKWSRLLLCFLENPFIEYLAKISLEVYALQGIVLRTLHPHILNQYLFAVAGFVCTILLAIPMQKLLSVINRKICRG